MCLVLRIVSLAIIHRSIVNRRLLSWRRVAGDYIQVGVLSAVEFRVIYIAACALLWLEDGLVDRQGSRFGLRAILAADYNRQLIALGRDLAVGSQILLT